MQRTYDFFSLTGLPFDPPAKTQRQIVKAVSEAVSKLSNQLGRETQQFQRDALQTQIDFLNQQSALINSAGWTEASKRFVEMAEKRKAQEYERVQFTASLLVQNGIKSLNKGVLLSFRQKTGLSTETLTQVLVKSGIALSSDVFGEKFPKFPVSGERILLELERLRATKDPNPNGPDTSVVTDLYAFVAYLMDDLIHADLYKNLSTNELKTIVDLAARKYSFRNDELGKLCGSISASASQYIFNSDDNRKGYEALMLYHHVALQSLFDALKMLPSGILLQPDFAENCIKLIGVFFPDYETALSIYNKEGNLAEVPYVPHENNASDADVCREDQIANPKCSKSRVYGIDLGATYSSISTLDDDGHPNVIANWEDGSDFLASAVYFPREENPVVGEIAKAHIEIEPERVVQFVTRYLGKSDVPVYEFDGVKYDPVTITVLILKKMKSYAEEQGHDVRDVVVACPAYYGYEERNAIKQAGALAGLNVLSIINEPTAAALFYLSGKVINKSKTILVYDLGGSTLDLCLMELNIDSNEIPSLTIINIDGDDRLGGVDWDARMFDYMCQKYAFENGIEVSNMDDELRATIRAQVEQAKKDLSTREKKSYTIKYDGYRTRIELTRQEFEDLTQDLVQQTVKRIYSLFSRTKYKPEDVDDVLLVGGSAQMPMIRNAVETIFPEKVIADQPNLIASKGAAIASVCDYEICEPSVGEPEDRPAPWPSSDKAKKTIGVGIFDSDGYKINNILFVDDDLPTETRRKYYTASESLEKICVTLYSNVSKDEFIASCDNEYGNPQTTDPCLDIRRIGVFQILLPPGTPKGAEIVVLFRNTGDTLEVKATVVKTGVETTTVFEL